MSITRKPVSDPGLHVAPDNGMETNRDGLEPTPSYPHYTQYPQPTQYHQQYLPYSPQSTHKQEQYETPRQSRKRLWGIPALAFWLLLVLIVGLIAAIAVVGGVLGSRHTSSPPNPTPTATRTVTSSTPPTTVTTTASAVSATSTFACTRNGTIFTSSTGSTFTTLCSQDLGMGKAWNNTNADLAVVHVDSYGACIDACGLAREEDIIFGHAAGSCTAVVWVSAGSGYGDCWLKNGTGTPHYNAAIQAAILLTA